MIIKEFVCIVGKEFMLTAPCIEYSLSGIEALAHGHPQRGLLRQSPTPYFLYRKKKERGGAHDRVRGRHMAMADVPFSMYEGIG